MLIIYIIIILYIIIIYYDQNRQHKNLCEFVYCVN